MLARKVQIRIRVFAMAALAGILALGGCGKEELGNGPTGRSGSPESDTEQLMAYKDIRYLPEFTDTSKKYDAFGSSGIGFVNDTFYLLKRQNTDREASISAGGRQLAVCNPDTGEEKVLMEDDDGQKSRIHAAAPMEDGSVVVFLSVWEGNGEETGDIDESYRLCRVDSDGNGIFSRDYPKLPLTETDMPNLKITTDSQGRCYLMGREDLLLFDDEGLHAGTVDLGGKRILGAACSGNGKVYLHEYDTNQLIPVDFEKTRLDMGAACSVMRSMQVLVSSKKADFLICDETTVYQFSCADHSFTPLFDLQDSQILNAYNLDTIGEMEDGRIFLFSNDKMGTTEMAILTPTPLSECPIQKTITFGTAFPSRALVERVAKFNRQSEDFTVSILNYSVGGRSYQQACDALRLDLSIGKGPDLCNLDTIGDTESLYSAGCFADLSPYLEASVQIGREDFFSQALDAYTWQGKLMSIPESFALQTIAGRSDIVGEAMGWNMEDIKAVIRSHPDAEMLFDNMPADYLFEACIRNLLEEFVDLEGKKADLDSAEYIDFLNFMNALPDGYKEDYEAEETGVRLQDEKALLSLKTIYSFSDLELMDFAFKAPYTCVGYPASDRTPDCLIFCSGANAITAASSEKECAWKFMEWYYSQEPRKEYSLFVAPMPARKEAFEQALKEVAGEAGGREEELGGIYRNGSLVNFRWVTQEEAELLYSLLECARPETNSEQTILEIMKEEAACLFGGSKTAEAVAKITQNRVQLYLDSK